MSAKAIRRKLLRAWVRVSYNSDQKSSKHIFT